jgi:cell wall-associated NlpC family hydrolase
MPETTRQVILPFVDVREEPEAKAPRGKMETQLVFGEAFKVEEEKSGWCRGYCMHDRYPGWVPMAALAKKALASTHIVIAQRTHAFSGPTIKSELVRTYSFGSKLRVAAQGEKFSQLEDGSWLYRPHLIPRAQIEKDHIETAKKFLETPYYWGGRSGFGIDCSGLVQVSLMRAGVAVARDTSEQIHSAGRPADTPRRGHLVFFEGHVGIMADNTHLLHANAHHMKVCIEPLADVVARGTPITAVRRI